jgi:condensin complex subunit 1
MDPKDIARDSSGTRCVASFLVEVAEKIPLVMLPSISVLMDYNNIRKPNAGSL